MNARALVLHRTAGGHRNLRPRPYGGTVRAFLLPGQRHTEPVAPAPSAPEPAPTTDLRARLGQRRDTVQELAQALREHSLVAELVASNQPG